MKQLRKHSVLVFLLGLALFYSAPIKSLHDCNNLKHFNLELSFEQHHEDCSICEFQSSPFDFCIFSFKAQEPKNFLSHSERTQSFNNLIQFFADFNKGPPALQA